MFSLLAYCGLSRHQYVLSFALWWEPQQPADIKCLQISFKLSCNNSRSKDSCNNSNGHHLQASTRNRGHQRNRFTGVKMPVETAPGVSYTINVYNNQTGVINISTHYGREADSPANEWSMSATFGGLLQRVYRWLWNRCWSRTLLWNQQCHPSPYLWCGAQALWPDGMAAVTSGRSREHWRSEADVQSSWFDSWAVFLSIRGQSNKVVF